MYLKRSKVLHLFIENTLAWFCVFLKSKNQPKCIQHRANDFILFSIFWKWTREQCLIWIFRLTTGVMYQYQTLYVYSMPGTKTATDAEAMRSSFTIAIRVRYSASACGMLIWSQGQSNEHKHQRDWFF